MIVVIFLGRVLNRLLSRFDVPLGDLKLLSTQCIVVNHVTRREAQSIFHHALVGLMKELGPREVARLKDRVAIDLLDEDGLLFSLSELAAQLIVDILLLHFQLI